MPALSRMAAADTYPSRPITMVVPFAAGGGDRYFRADLVRTDGKKALGQSIIVENVTGAGGSIGVARVVHAAPDGYTAERRHLDDPCSDPAGFTSWISIC